jgi:Putative auto-transporter adhesin, head GIN domain
VKLSGDGMMSVSGISAQRLTVTVPGEGMLSVTGTAAWLDVTLAGDGQAQLSGLVARDVHAVLTGSGLIQVTATSSLDAAVPGEGAIMYGGNPLHVTTSITGNGAVTPG